VGRIGRQETVLSRISELTDAPTITFGNDSVRLGAPHVVFDNVSFAYDESIVLRDLSFEIPSGNIVAIVGPSGGGKSTIARLTARFFDPQAGSVSIGGANLRSLPPAQLAGLVATVFQDPILFSDSIAANIRIGRESASDKEVARAAELAQAHDFITALPDGYRTVLAEGGKSLSLGQRQRIAIARALICDAPVLVLDEITAFADPETETLVQRALDELLAGQRTVLLIAHRLRTAMGADRILVVDKGQIVESGTHAALLTRNGLYARLWDTQTAGTRLHKATAESAVP
jgi:ATP-binding cassette subfamily B protein